MNDQLLEQLLDGPQTLAQLSDELMWEEGVVELVLSVACERGDVYPEIDGTYWLAAEIQS